MYKKQKQSKITGKSEDQIKEFIISLDKDVFNIFQYANALPYSSGTTGGSASAGAGKQYVELVIGTQKFKILHDGTV